MQIQKQLHASKISRRSFMIRAGGLGIAVAFGGIPNLAAGAIITGQSTGSFQPNAWVTIADDGSVTIVSPASEMGQGIMTTLPLLIAEEMDADWDRTRIIQAPSDAERYGNPGFYGMQLTGGSESTRGYYELLRMTGAQTRKVLLACAAEMLNVPVDELSTSPGKIMHKASGKSLDYGDVARLGQIPDPLPQAEKTDLKSPDQWHYIGRKDIPRIDVPSKTNGTAIFGIDVQQPDMLFGAVLRAPVQGEKPLNINDREAKAIAGISHIFPLSYGVGIIGKTVEATKKAKDLLDVTWSTNSRVRDYDSALLLEEYRKVGADINQSGVDAHNKGNAKAIIQQANKVLSADYLSDHVYHATMEPMNATALVKGGTVELWAPTQGPTFTQRFAANVAGTTPDKVTVHTTMLGGGFGRRAEDDFIIDAVSLAMQVKGTPVKVIWSREDDVQHGKYRPLTAQHLEVGLTDDGGIAGWHHRIVADSIFARTFPQAFSGANGLDDVITEGSDFKYGIPAHHIEYIRQDRGLDVGFWRAVGSGYTKFAIECMIDEIATAQGKDPVDLRLEMLKDVPRASEVIKQVAQKARWHEKRENTALGLAYSDSFGAHCALVAEIALNRENGTIRVINVWGVVDPGVAIQPRNIDAQMVGAINHGISHALFEQINVVKGEVQEGNFDTYRVLRMSEMPEIDISIHATPENKPSGIGEVGLPPVGPAIANAVARLTNGTRLRHYPFLPERVLAALDA
ncbi:xanthine dehydrogenase family protein molybdopterin-binding subunit [Thalassospira marina]|uniref:Carbon monoxide dehydrogenase n=1 Tax=Thalassospira marina TaxID=2048283 RepID=A0A2N3KTG7_9PROT|nr:molybdopterin cofactor-binding domain-containing protein [Thalassospira marina]PKR53763.1 carbon monoxide dehydrogenase [Thalassospira marina]